jgi:hypothetical protein
MAGACVAGAGIAGLALLAGCQLLVDFAPLEADGGPADSGTPPVDSAVADAADLCDEREPNETLDQALPVEPGSFQAAICPGGDIDFYGFSLDGSEDLLVEVTFAAGPNDIEMELQDQEGDVVTISTGVDGDERIERSPQVSGRLAAGSYAVRLFGREDTAQNDYQLSAPVSGCRASCPARPVRRACAARPRSCDRR